MNVSTFICHYKGDECVANLEKYGNKLFEEFKDIEQNGINIGGVPHDIRNVCTCDWKGAALLEGTHTVKVVIMFSL